MRSYPAGLALSRRLSFDPAEKSAWNNDAPSRGRRAGRVTREADDYHERRERNHGTEGRNTRIVRGDFGAADAPIEAYPRLCGVNYGTELLG